MRTDGQTDMTKLINAFRNFAKAPKNEPSDSLNMRKISSIFLRATAKLWPKLPHC